MKTVKLIVYGTLLTNEANHRYCKNAISIQKCTIKGTLYDTGWGFPAFEPIGDNEVHAELIEIPIADWKNIDRLEGVPVLYNRKIYPCTLANGTTTEAWVYIINNLPSQAKIIKSGNWKER